MARLGKRERALRKLAFAANGTTQTLAQRQAIVKANTVYTSKSEKPLDFGQGRMLYQNPKGAFRLRHHWNS